jgi:hypothetical protein
MGERPDWQEANPRFISEALASATALPSGGWFVLAASGSVGRRPCRFEVDGRELVAWRAPAGDLRVGPATCPHMGADLSLGKVDGQGCIVCPWHGLALGPRPHAAWRPLRAFDDGVLCWVRLTDDETSTDRPLLPKRPDVHVTSVLHLEARCDPEDVIANRLDPWHGVHLHPRSFGRLQVLSAEREEIRVEVSYLVARRLSVTVEASFTSPDPRTIVMTITAGEGRGSVVETHATPRFPGRTSVVEATLVTSERPGFLYATRLPAPVRWAAAHAARRLWVDDLVYAERLYELRRRRTAGSDASSPRGGTDHRGC